MNQSLFYNAKNQYYSNNERKSEQNNLIKGIQLAKNRNFQKNTVMENEYPGVVHCVLNMPTKSH